MPQASFDTHRRAIDGCWAEWERRILHGLACEWRLAVGDLPESVRAAARPPLFRIAGLQSRWGQWSGPRREICLSRELVRSHSWDSVREVLLHETAHQVAAEVFAAGDEPPHGPAFRRACRMLGANPAASGESLALDDRIRSGTVPGSRPDRLRERIGKLLALAESSNPHEAEAAMAKAHRMMARHQIEVLERDEARRFVSAFVGLPALRHTRDRYALANLIIDHFFVQGMWVPAYVVDRSRMGRVLEVSGTPANVQMAGYVHDFVRHHVASAWRAYNRGKGLTHHRKVDFAAGVITGFAQKLEGQRHRPRTDGSADLPVPVDDPRLERYMRRRYPRVRSIRRGGGRQDAHVVADGIAVGRKLVLAKGVHAREGNGGGLLER
jgi:hypothetical protein